jgi:putative addiction module component (TIGR02574 family)
MPIDIHALGIDRLSVGERLDLIEEIWRSLPDQVDASEIPAWHLVELAKRRQDAEEHPAAGKPWREVLGQIESES